MQRIIWMVGLLAAAMPGLIAAGTQTTPSELIKQLTGKEPAEIDDWHEAYGRAIDLLVPTLSADKRPKRFSAQMTVENLAMAATRPSGESAARRSALNRVIADRLTDDTVPLPAKYWLVSQLQRTGGADVVEPLASLLDHEDAKLAELARRALQHNPTPGAHEALRSALNERASHEKQIAYLNALAQQPDRTRPDLIAPYVSSDNQDVALAAVDALSQLPARASLRALQDVPAEREPALQPRLDAARVKVAQTLADAGTNGEREHGLKTLRSLYADGTSPAVRGAALYALLVHDPAQTTGLYRKALESDSVVRQKVALRAAHHAGGSAVTESLTESLDGASAWMRQRLLSALASRGDPVALAELIHWAEADNVDTHARVQAIAGLEAIGGEKAARTLLSLASDESKPAKVAKRAQRALGRIPGDDIDSLVARRAKEGEPRARTAAINVLIERRMSEQVDALLDWTIGDQPRAVHRAAMTALAEMAGPEHLPRLLDALADRAQPPAVDGLRRAVGSVLRRTDTPMQYADLLVKTYERVGPGKQRALVGLFTDTPTEPALRTVVSATRNDNDALREAAIEALSDWPTPAAAPPLLELAKQATDADRRLNALRALGQRLRAAEDMALDKRVELAVAGLELTERKEDKWAMLSALSVLPHPRALSLATAQLSDAEVRRSAASAVVNIAAGLGAEHAEAKARALRQVLDAKGVSESVKTDARKVMSNLPEAAVEAAEHDRQSKGGNKLDALIITGLNENHEYHDVEAVTPVLIDALRRARRFDIDVANVNGRAKAFAPDFQAHDVIVSIYNGPGWSQATKDAFEKYMKDGGGFVTVHAANNAFPDWPAYNRIIGVGGWGGRDQSDGPSLHWENGRIVRDTSPGSAGTHGAQWPFGITTRRRDHPILNGLPDRWRHAPDELYARLRGPAKRLSVLATGKSRKTGRHEPLLMTIRFGEGRTFHTTLGHDVKAARCAGFQHTLARGAEWAATGEVTLRKPDDFPNAEQVSLRDMP